jgi:hypothetical protein
VKQFQEFKREALENPGIRAAYDALEEEYRAARARVAAGVLSDKAIAAYSPINAAWTQIAVTALLKQTHLTVMWSGEDQMYIGRSEGLVSLAAHGDTPEAAFAEIIAVTRAVLEDLVLEDLADGNR